MHKENALCDLHVHSTFSDGSETPEELIATAERLGVKALALCDHNNINGLLRFTEAARGSKVIPVAGVEVTSSYRGKEVHILGLFIKPEYRCRLTEYFKEINRRKEESNERLAEKLRAAGYDIDYAEIKSKAKDTVPNRVHFSNALIEKGYVGSLDEAFAGILKDGGAYYMSAEKLDSLDVIRFLVSVEAFPVMAHPLLNLNEEELREFLPEARAAGLRGIEAHYSGFGDAETALLTRLALEFRLTVSGGSDYHGTNKQNSMGRAKDGVPLHCSIYEAVEAAHSVTHEMKLKPLPFGQMRDGKKTVELRLYDEKRSKIEIGDRIVFRNTEDPELTLSARVTALYRFENFKELYAAIPPVKYGYADNEEGHYTDMELYYSREEQGKYGVLGIEIKLYN